MNITAEITLNPKNANGVAAYATLVIDGGLVVHGVRIVRTRRPKPGQPTLLVAMPSKKVTTSCGRCDERNHLRANYCNGCGEKLNVPEVPEDRQSKLYVDTVHPINPETRRLVEVAVMGAYRLALAAPPAEVQS